MRWQLCNQGWLNGPGKWNQQEIKLMYLLSPAKENWCGEQNVTDVLAEGPGDLLPTTQGRHQQWIR